MWGVESNICHQEALYFKWNPWPFCTLICVFLSPFVGVANSFFSSGICFFFVREYCALCWYLFLWQSKAQAVHCQIPYFDNMLYFLALMVGPKRWTPRGSGSDHGIYDAPLTGPPRMLVRTRGNPASSVSPARRRCSQTLIGFTAFFTLCICC
jgi:hypothetical protein